MLKGATLIAGPTASGKSSLALEVARSTGGIVVNADSMQVYSILSILTARPGEDDLSQAPHMLYGHVHPGENYSTGQWLREVEALLTSGEVAGRPLVFVGGTGLYFRALLGGLSPMPEIPQETRLRWRERLAVEGPESLHRLLQEKDPITAGRIRPADGQRIIRALEVLEASGRPLSEWQSRNAPPLIESASARKIVLQADPAILARRIDERCDRMLEEGGLDEVQALLALKLSPSMPAMKAIGVSELAGVLEGRTSVEEAALLMKAATRQYAKRQRTWFRHQLDQEWKKITTS